MYVRPVKFINCLTDVTLIIKLPIGVMTKCERCIVVQTIKIIRSIHSLPSCLKKKKKEKLAVLGKFICGVSGISLLWTIDFMKANWSTFQKVLMK